MDNNSTRKPSRAVNFKFWENNTKDTLQVCIGSDASIANAEAFLAEEYKIAYLKHDVKTRGIGYMQAKFQYEQPSSHEYLASKENSFKDLDYTQYHNYKENDFFVSPVVLRLSDLRDIKTKQFLNEGQESVRFILTGKLPKELISVIHAELIRWRVKSAQIVKINGRFSQRTVDQLQDFILDIDEDLQDQLPPLPSEDVDHVLPFGESFEKYKFPFPKFNSDGFATGAIAHVDNLKYVLKRYGITIRYNVISKKDELILDDGVVHLIDNRKAESIEIVKSLCELNSFPISRVESQLLAISNANPYNPVIEYCTSKEWDNVDRIGAILDTVGVDESLLSWRNAIILKFMVSAICAAINDENKRFKFKTVLTFQGEQGLGKTPWIKILTGDLNRYFLEGHILNPTEKDSCTLALTHWITELGELDATTKKTDVANQKAFIDRSEDKYRLPYARTNSEWARRTVFFGTVNPSSFLVDNTGNDRYWCLPVKSLDLDSLENVDMQQLWAQIYTMTNNELSNGNREPWQLTKEEHDFQRQINESFRSLTAVEEALIDTFEPIKNQQRKYQANISDILSIIGFPYANEKERASAKIWIEKFFGSPGVYNGKRGWAIPSVPGKNEFDHMITYKMKKRS